MDGGGNGTYFEIVHRDGRKQIIDFACDGQTDRAGLYESRLNFHRIRDLNPVFDDGEIKDSTSYEISFSDEDQKLLRKLISKHKNYGLGKINVKNQSPQK